MIELRPLGLSCLVPSRWLALGCCLATGCGGGAQSTPGAHDAHGEEAVASSDTSSGTDEEVQSSKSVDPCTSGTCTRCGDAVCLTGFYCEESVSACGWVPECAESPSCSCLGKYLDGCSCDERAGGVYVTCDG
jgi:hypothetical protein